MFSSPRLHGNYSSCGAPTGQTPSQAPQDTQASSSITYLPSPSEIALFGHSSAHAPHMMQSSEILYAIKYTSKLLYSNYTRIRAKMQYSKLINVLSRIQLFRGKSGVALVVIAVVDALHIRRSCCWYYYRACGRFNQPRLCVQKKSRRRVARPSIVLVFSGGLYVHIWANAAADLSILRFEAFDVFANQNKNVAVHRTPFIIRNKAEFLKHFYTQPFSERHRRSYETVRYRGSLLSAIL